MPYDGSAWIAFRRILRERSMSERTVAIIGGGLTGLSLAEAIHRKSRAAGVPIRAVVLEAESTVGGKIKTGHEEGFVVETGPHGFLDKEPLLLDLIGRLNLEPSVVRADEAARKRFVVRKGKLRLLPSSPLSFLVSDALPWWSRLRVLLEPWSRRSEDVEESVLQFASRRIGTEAAEVLVDAMVTGIYGGDPKQLSLRAAFPRMFELESRYGSLIRAQIALARESRSRNGLSPAPRAAAGAPAGTIHSFVRGLGALIAALAERAEIRTGFCASAIRIPNAGSDAKGASTFASERENFVVEGTGTAEAVRCHAVALTVPAYDTEVLLRPHAEEEARAIGTIPYAPVGVVVQAFRKKDIAPSLDGFGFLAPHREGRRVLGSLFASTIFPAHAPTGTVMLRTLLGGMRSPGVTLGDDEDLLRTAREELGVLIGLSKDARPILEKVIRWDRAIPQYVLGHLGRVAAAESLEARFPGLFISGNAFRGVAMASCVADANRSADRILDHFLRT